eukprot:4872632-Amphidinium_carterae.1
MNTTVIASNQTYKQHHYHDYSVITSDKHMDEEYAKHMFVEICQTSREKKTIPYSNRFVTFMIQYHPQRTVTIMKRAGCSTRKMTEAFDYFDNNVHRLYAKPNVRPLFQPEDHRQGHSEDEKDETDDDENNESIREQQETVHSKRTWKDRMTWRRTTITRAELLPGTELPHDDREFPRSLTASANYSYDYRRLDYKGRHKTYATTSTCHKLNYYLFGYLDDIGNLVYIEYDTNDRYCVQMNTTVYDHFNHI